MGVSITTLAFMLALSASNQACVLAEDTFNYRETSEDSYGPSDWDQVDCGDLETCVSRENPILISVSVKLIDRTLPQPWQSSAFVF